MRWTLGLGLGLGLLGVVACTRLEVLSATPCEPSAEGTPCAFAGSCFRHTDAGCLSTVRCRDGAVWHSEPDCAGEASDGGAGDAGTHVTRCAADPDCGMGALCLDGGCAACPSEHPCQPPAEGTYTELPRNGCRTCEYVPSYDVDCAEAGPCRGSMTCYQGARCAAGCERFDCCANQCATPGCTGPAPLGCLARCPESLACASCVTTHCSCEAGAWTCQLACASVSSTCLYPP